MGRTLETTDRTLTIAGVMPPGFRFPDGRVRIWRALDYERLVNPRVMTFVGRLARPVTLTEAGALLEARLPDGVSAGHDFASEAGGQSRP